MFRNTAPGAGYGLWPRCRWTTPARRVRSPTRPATGCTPRSSSCPACASNAGSSPRSRPTCSTAPASTRLLAAARHPEPHPDLPRLPPGRQHRVHHRHGLRHRRFLHADGDPRHRRPRLRQPRRLHRRHRRQKLTAADRNFWGVTFGADDNVFYATAASGGHTWLVRATSPSAPSPASMTAWNAHRCPRTAPASPSRRTCRAVPSHTGRSRCSTSPPARRRCSARQRSVDDQVEWLDNDTLLYGLPRTDAPGDSDIWSVAARLAPAVFIPHAWSPSVVR